MNLAFTCFLINYLYFKIRNPFGEVYYKEKALDRIVLYCQRDVVAVAQIILRLRRDELLIDDEIFYV
uniref:hypothetical protein n=1 Tax=Flavobacterium sp. TaxID=239 RepID=UPI00404B90BB